MFKELKKLFFRKRISRYLKSVFLFLTLIIFLSFFISFKILFELSGVILLLFLLEKIRLRNFDFPISVLVKTKPQELNLNYYINSPTLFGISLSKKSLNKKFLFDDEGIIKYNYGGDKGIQYNPSFICWYALINLNEYLKTNEKQYLKEFWKHANWLKNNGKENENGAIVWEYNFQWVTKYGILKVPWISAMSQGLAISVLVRAYKLSAKREFLELARKAALPFKYNPKEGGIRKKEKSTILYQEYPVNSLHILDGFLFSLIGLYDLYLVTRDEGINRLFEEGLNGLITNLSKWDFKGFWSREGWDGRPLPGMYNKLNISLLTVIFQITGNKYLLDFTKKWSPQNLTLGRRLIIVIYEFLGKIADGYQAFKFYLKENERNIQKT